MGQVSWQRACIAGVAILALLQLVIEAHPIWILPSAANVPVQSPVRTLAHGVTILLACVVLDTTLRYRLGMRCALQALAILLGGVGCSVTIEAIAYLQPISPAIAEQHYHFAMQNLIAALVFAATYVGLRRVLIPQTRSELSVVVGGAHTRAQSLGIDVFAATNLLLFVAMTAFFYRDRFIHYRGQAHIGEFYAYALLIFSAICVLWRVFRHAALPAAVLVGLQVGILMHFAGGMVFPEGGRLYDLHFAGIRFDKYVHLVNGCAAGLLVQWIWRRGGVCQGGLASVSVVLAVLGLGGVVEVAEYFVYCTVPSNGVGGYDNNMQDLYSNLAGALTALLINRQLSVIARC